MGFSRFITGAAEQATKGIEARQAAKAEQQSLAYQELLRRETKQIPQAISPELAEYYKTTAATGQQQATTADFKSKADIWTSTIDPVTGEFYKGMEIIGSQTEADLLRDYGSVFQKGGILEKGGGKTLQEQTSLNVLRDFVNSPTAENRKKIMQASGLVPGVSRDNISKEKIKEIAKAGVQFNQTVSMFKRMVAQVKGQQEEQSGLGLGPGLKGKIGVALKRPEFARTAAAFGQRVETSLKLNSILTGQNRVIKSVVSMIQQSLPQQYDPEPTVASKIAQSVRNAYGLVKSFQKVGLTSEKLKSMSQDELDNIDAGNIVAQYNLTPQEEQEIEAIIQDILVTSASPVRTLGRKVQKKPSVSTEKYTEEDIQFTMQKHKLSREEVLKRLR